MRARLRALLVQFGSVALGPNLARLDEMNESLNTRLETVIRRLDEIDALIQSYDGRVAAVAERSTAQVETSVRLARRLDEIEKLLAVPATAGIRPGDNGDTGDS